MEGEKKNEKKKGKTTEFSTLSFAASLVSLPSPPPLPPLGDEPSSRRRFRTACRRAVRSIEFVRNNKKLCGDVQISFCRRLWDSDGKRQFAADTTLFLLSPPPSLPPPRVARVCYIVCVHVSHFDTRYLRATCYDVTDPAPG